MKKNEIKGLSVFELLEGLDDDMIASAALPEAAPVAPPTAGERITAFFVRMGKGGMAAAITGIAVAAAVLLGIALARPFGVIDPPDTDPSQGIHGTQPHESGNLPDTNNGIVAPPLTQNPEQEKGKVAVVSDGATVHPKGYCVYVSGQQIGADGELVHFDGDGPGAVTRLEEIAEEIPSLRTGGNSYVLLLPSNTSVQRLRVFAVSESRPDGWAPILDCSAEQSGGRDLVTRLKGLSDGRYMVVLNAVYSSYASENEYKRGEDEYAFFLTVDSSMDAAFPVRVIHGDKTYFPTDYTLEKIYYDAEQQKEIVKKYDGAVKILGELTDDMPTATVVRGESLSLYLAPFYDLRTVRIFRSDLTEWVETGTDNPLDHISGWEAGEYYAVITAVYLGTGESEISEFPVRVCLVEPKE